MARPQTDNIFDFEEFTYVPDFYPKRSVIHNFQNSKKQKSMCHSGFLKLAILSTTGSAWWKKAKKVLRISTEQSLLRVICILEIQVPIIRHCRLANQPRFIQRLDNFFR